MNEKKNCGNFPIIAMATRQFNTIATTHTACVFATQVLYNAKITVMLQSAQSVDKQNNLTKWTFSIINFWHE